MSNSNVSKLLLSAVDRFSTPVNNSSKSVGNLKQSVSSAAKELKAFEKDKGMITRFKSLSTQLNDTQLKLAGARSETNRLKQSEQDAISIVKKHTSSLKLAEKSVVDAAAAYGAKSAQVKAASKEVARLTKSKKQAEIALKKRACGFKIS